MLGKCCILFSVKSTLFNAQVYYRIVFILCQLFLFIDFTRFTHIIVISVFLTLYKNSHFTSFNFVNSLPLQKSLL